jgi:DNA processing protein
MQSTASTQLTDGERLERLRLTRTESVGPVTFRQLMARFGTAAEAIEALPELARRGGRHRPIRICPRDEAERERDALTAFGGTHLFPGEAGYPDTLSAIDDAPMVLSVVGAAPLLKREAVAVVGARNASTSGRSFARRLAADLAAAGLVVVSGMARGIDAAAHAGAAEATVAVLAGGVDVIYPRENADLYARIREQGLLVSEMSFGLQPQARHFPRRNRIISGLSRGVLVVEAALRSGSLITARLAAEQGRDVFAVPGSPLDPRCRGPNDLIRKGAILTSRRRTSCPNCRAPSLAFRPSRARKARPSRGPATILLPTCRGKYLNAWVYRRFRSTISCATPGVRPAMSEARCWNWNWPAGSSAVPEISSPGWSIRKITDNRFKRIGNSP